jgi:hypothetical protein
MEALAVVVASSLFKKQDKAKVTRGGFAHLQNTSLRIKNRVNLHPAGALLVFGDGVNESVWQNWAHSW